MNLKHKLYEEAGDTNGGDGAAPAITAVPAVPAADGTKAGDANGTGIQASDDSKDIKATWPADWRNQFAGKDEVALKRLDRFTSPNDVFKSYRAMEQKLSSGEFKSTVTYPDKGTPEQQSEWRTQNGIPVSADKYELKLNDGIVIGELDKPIIDGFLEAAHSANMPTNLASAAVQWYYDQQDKQAEAMYDRDQVAKQSFEDTLRPEWGGEYRVNINSINGILDLAPEGVKEKFLNGRLADGTPIGSDQDTMRWMASLARQINPITTLVPGAGANMASAIDDEIGKIEETMRTSRNTYNKDEKMQSRYRDLLEARDRNKVRG